MQIRVLGPFQLEEGGRRITIGGARQRAVLADLLLHANEAVPSERLLLDLWSEDSPPSAANALQAAISRLRRVLPPGRLITTPPGYTLRIFPAELDVKHFEQLISEGRDALRAGVPAEAERMLGQALSLWRGPPLADFRYEPFAQAEIARLEELQLTCLEERIEAKLALGPADALTADLQQLVSEYPLRERLRGQLMLALYRSGRQAEALEAYREFRIALREELGLEPSPLLRELEGAILRQDPALSRRSASTGAPLARRPVTVLCVLQTESRSDVALDPEAQQVVNEHSVSALTAVLERYGGTLAISTGERLMGVFGVASLHEDDALRAVRASLETRDVLNAAASVLLRQHGASLAYHFGLATGEALVGGSGPLGFAGDVAPHAERLAAAAEPGQILISGQTQQLAAAAIETESVGPGRFVVRSAHAGMRPLAMRLDAPLVNRADEMRRLQAAYVRAARQRVTITVTLTGEAGIGKTRLVHELAQRIGPEVKVLTGRCLPYGEGITFWPLRELVRQAESAAHGSAKTIRALVEGEPNAASIAEWLHHAVGSGSQGKADAAEIFWVARRFLEALARSQPLLIVFEDLHWAEPTFLDLVESLALQPGQAPIVLVCVGRPELLEQRPAWAAEADRTVRIELAPLADGPAAELLDVLAGDQRIPASTRAQLMDTAGGNPLYLEQLAVSLSEQTESAVRLVLPPSIQALLAARLQRLGPGASSVLACAAIIGKYFGVQEVRELLPSEARDPLTRNLQALVLKGLVQHQPPNAAPEEEYSFRHILIQQAAYRAIPKSLRAELHHNYADWLESVSPELIPQNAEILGYHLEQSVHYWTELRPADALTAGLSRRAAAHLETAGSAAYDRGDAFAAVNLLDRAAALLPDDEPAAGRLYTGLGAALTETGYLERARATLDRAQRVAAANGDEGQLAHARVQALLLRLRMDQSDAATEITRALPELRRVFDQNEDDLGICRTLQLEAALHWNHARSALAEEAWQRAAEYARSANDRRQLTEILSWLASAALWGPTSAPQGIRRCADYLDEIGNHPVGRAMILLHLSGLHAMQDDFMGAHATLDRAKILLESLGPTMTAAITQPAAHIAMLEGDPATAETYIRREYESLTKMGERRYLATTAVTLARAIVAQGQSRYDEATQLIAISRKAAAGEDPSAEAVGQALSARILSDRGRHAEAQALARAAETLTAQTDLLSERADTLLDLAHVLAAASQTSEARAAATQALDLYRRKGNLPGVRESLRYLAQYAPV